MQKLQFIFKNEAIPGTEHEGKETNGSHFHVRFLHIDLLWDRIRPPEQLTVASESDTLRKFI